MARRERSAGMESPSPTLLIVGVCGALVVAGAAVMIGSSLRVQTRLNPESRSVVVPTDEVFTDGAPAYPDWAPEPLYPRAERDPMDEFSTAWDESMEDRSRASGPVVLRPPSDLPPPYEVRIERDTRLAPQPELRETQPARPTNNGRYSYRGYDAPSTAAQPVAPPEDDKSRY